jgi:hypothetical protein
VAAVVVALWRAGIVLHAAVALSLAVAGVANLWWPLQESSIDAPMAWCLVVAGELVAVDALATEWWGTVGE